MPLLGTLPRAFGIAAIELGRRLAKLLAGVIELVARLMRANRTTGRQITTGDSRPGRTHWVYGRMGEPCRRCGTPIERDAPATTFDRVTYWCPNCQPLKVAYTAGTKGSS